MGTQTSNENNKKEKQLHKLVSLSHLQGFHDWSLGYWIMCRDSNLWWFVRNEFLTFDENKKNGPKPNEVNIPSLQFAVPRACELWLHHDSLISYWNFLIHGALYRHMCRVGHYKVEIDRNIRLSSISLNMHCAVHVLWFEQIRICQNSECRDGWVQMCDCNIAEWCRIIGLWRSPPPLPNELIHLLFSFSQIGFRSRLVWH